MKLCKDCKHYSRTYDGYWIGEKCLHPNTAIRSLVDGAVILRRPGDIRADKDGACGPDGALFAQKTDALKICGRPANIPGRRKPILGEFTDFLRFLLGHRAPAD